MINILKQKYANVLRLMNLPEIKQKSLEWFNIRDVLITASQCGSILNQNTYETCDDVIYKKITNERNKDSVFTLHGKKFECVAKLIYESFYNSHVLDIGLIIHKEHTFLGASPDGIVNLTNKNNKIDKNVNRIIEIKCPMSRDIEEIPIYYWIQTQIQMECCDSEECDFFQCKIFEYKSLNSWLLSECIIIDEKSRFTIDDLNIINDNVAADINIQDIIDMKTDDKKNIVENTENDKNNENNENKLLINKSGYNFKKNMMNKKYFDKYNKICDLEDKILNDDLKYIKGIIIECKHKYIETEENIYIYPKELYKNIKEYLIWIKNVVDNFDIFYPEYKNYEYKDIILWKAKKISKFNIKRDTNWFKDNVEEMRKAWEKIEYLKKNEKDKNIFVENYKKLKESEPSRKNYYSQNKQNVSQNIQQNDSQNDSQNEFQYNSRNTECLLSSESLKKMFDKK